MNENLNQTNMITPNEPQKKNNGGIIAIVIAFIALLSVGAFLLFKKDNEPTNNKKTETKEENKKEETNKPEEDKKEDDKKEEPSIEKVWSGIYSNDNSTLKIYQVDSNEIRFDIEGDSYISGSATINGNKATGEIFSTYSFELNDKTISFTTDDEDIANATFTKTNDYSKEDFYKDNIGDPTLVSSNINGIFENNGITIKIYQISETEASILINSDNSYFSRDIEIKDNKLILNDTFLDDVETMEATITNGVLTIEGSSTDKDSILNKIKGSYNKTKVYSIDDIIKENM